MSDRTYRCGDMEDGGNAEYARHCGGEAVSLHAHDMAAPMGYRCYDCKAIFCRACAPLHFGEEHQKARGALAASQADVTRLVGELATQTAMVTALKRLRGELESDVTRLAVELAESVRALAVSRAENETTLRQHGDLCGQIEELRRALAVSQGEVERHRQAYEDTVFLGRRLNNELLALRPEAERLRGDLERARGLLADVDWARGSGESFEEIVSGACLWCEEESPCPARVANVTADTLRPHAEDCAYAAWYRDTFLAEDAPSAPTASPEPDRASPEVTVKENETP